MGPAAEKTGPGVYAREGTDGISSSASMPADPPPSRSGPLPARSGSLSASLGILGCLRAVALGA
jgi:hypothetical protein